MNQTNRTRRAQLAVFLPAFSLALLSCKSDVTAPVNAGRRVVFTVQPTNTIMDSTIVSPVVSILNAAGVVDTTFKSSVGISIASNPGGADLNGVVIAFPIAGVATFSNIQITRAGNGYTLVASIDTINKVTSNAFNVTLQTNGPWASVVPGASATCGVTTSNVGYCWGSNNFGQLGNGGSANSTIPSKISGGIAFSTASAGSLAYFSCGLANGGAAYCWGYNDYGQLGNGTLNNSATPSPVLGSLAFTSLSVGLSGHACGLVGGGAAYCWGFNGAGQLGTSSIASSRNPVPVSGGLLFTMISAGQSNETCGVAVGGAAYCWGFNVDGELGNGSATNSSAPVAVAGGISFTSVSAGFASTCGVAVGGTAYCWGDNTYGELGNGTKTNSLTPVAVSGGLKFSSVAVGDAFACGVATSGTAYCWGYNAAGELGTGTLLQSSAPVPIAAAISFASISAGYGSACAVTTGGAAYCWGDNGFGQLGNASGNQSTFPVLVATPPQ